MSLLELAKKYEDYMVGLRRYFHENPEASGKEFETIARIKAELSDMGVDYIEVPDGGRLGFIEGRRAGKTVLLRADCDALPIDETENLKGNRVCFSKNPGLMHACGHDGHTAVLLGAARCLAELREELEGRVILCFERGEEGGGNVKYIFSYMDKQGVRPDACFGLHIEVGLPAGKIAVNDTNVLAGAMNFVITLEGSGGHGSRPDDAVNPIDCFTAIHQRLLSIRLNELSPFETCTYSVGMVEAGTRANIIPQTLTFAGSMRCFDTEGVGMVFREKFREAVDNISAAYGCKAIYNVYTVPYFATVNDPDYARLARKAIAAEIGEENVCIINPNMASESFSQYLRQWPGAFALLGIDNKEKGTGAPNHNCAFDMDEDSLVYGAVAHVSYALEFLRNTEPLSHGDKISYKECLRRLDREREIAELYE